MVKNNQNEIDWIDHYGFILVAFAHMTDWYLAGSELQVISEKMEFLLYQNKLVTDKGSYFL